MVIFLAIAISGGYLFPLPGITLAWVEWTRNRKAEVRNPWRSKLTTCALFLVSANIPLWAYAAVRELRDDYSYIFLSARFGRWSCLFLLVLSVFAEGRVKAYLLVAIAGLLLFYGATIGEWP